MIYLEQFSRTHIAVALVVFVSLSLALLLLPLLKDVQHLPEADTVTPAKARIEAEGRHKRNGFTAPYLTDAFPGGRQVRTVYGTIQVFEWGPEDGEKVLLVHGLGTPCLALGNMAKEFVDNNCRVMLFDLFGRGYSDAPNDIPHDARLYTTQLLLVLASSHLPWTAPNAFHLVGFSLGGSIAAAFAAYHASLLRSLTLVAPGSFIRKTHLSRRSNFIYSSPLLPEWLRLRLVRSELEPRNGTPSSAEIPDPDGSAEQDWDEVPLATDRPCARIGDVVRWQLRGNPGFAASYLSTVRSSLVFRRHDGAWRVLGEELARRRQGEEVLPGLPGGNICLVMAEKDVVVVTEELIEDLGQFLGWEDVDLYVLKGGHEVAILKGKDVTQIAMQSWSRHLCKRDVE